MKVALRARKRYTGFESGNGLSARKYENDFNQLQGRKNAKTCKRFEDQHIVEEMLRGPGAEGQASSCTHSTCVPGTRLQLMPTKRILVYLYVIAQTIFKSGAHDSTLKMEVISTLHELKPAECHATCCRGKPFVFPNRTFPQKGGILHEENVFCNMSSL